MLAVERSLASLTGIETLTDAGGACFSVVLRYFGCLTLHSLVFDLG